MKKRMMTLLLSFVMFASVLMPAQFAFAAIPELPYGETTLDKVTLPNWMSAIRGETKLTEITMPGTHDSAARNFRGIGALATGIAKCQDLTITEQLNAGVRFLDIRCECNPNDSTVWLVHGAVDCAAVNGGVYYLDTLFKELMAFVYAHPTETVLVSIKKDDGNYGPPSFTKLIYEYIHGYGQNRYYYGIDYRHENFWYLGKSVPALKDVRGKIVLVNRFDSDMEHEYDIGAIEAEAGQKINYGSQESTSYSTPVYQEYYNNNTGVGTAYVQDKYKWSNNDKVRATQEMLNMPHTAGHYYISYSSTTQNKLIPNPKNYANAINPQILNLNYTKNKPSGIYCFDFVNENLTRKIILNNEAVAHIVTGTTGSLTYRFNRYTKTLTISGNGSMPNYSASSPAPWSNQPSGSLFNGQYNSDLLEHIVIENGVTSIGNNAFAGFSKVKTVTVPNTLKSIGNNAFTNCYALTTFNTRPSVNSIANNAFSGCSAMKMYGAKNIYSEQYANARGIPYVRTN